MSRSLRLPAYPILASAPRGITLYGLDFNGHNLPGTQGTDYFQHSNADYAYIARKGFNIVRLALSWERVQPTLSGALDATYIGYVDQNVTWAAANGLKIVFDIQNFGGYILPVDTVYKIGTTQVTIANFSDFWSRMSARYAGNSGVFGYDLMNEPNFMPVTTTSANYNTTATWTLAAQAAINAIRANDTTSYIFAEFDGSASAEFFFTTYGANPTPWWTDSANKLYYTCHYYPDAAGTYTGVYRYFSGLGKSIYSGGDIMKAVLDWGVAHTVPICLGEHGIPPNDDAWAVLDNDVLNVCDQYPQTIVMYWAMGDHDTQNISVQPTNNFTTDAKQMAMVEQFHLGKAVT